MKKAQQITGLSDYGDESFVTVIEKILHSSRNDRQTEAYERYVLYKRLLIHLKNRLLIQKEVADYPAIHDVVIKRPLFITGLQRTGTTLLQNLLALDTNNRTLRDWEANPAPAPKPGSVIQRKRIRKGRVKHFTFRLLAPQIAAIHPGSATGPMECLPLLMNSFLFHTVPGFCDLTGFVAWHRQQNHSRAYDFYRLQLKLLQYGNPALQWVLKAPMHLENLPFLMKSFPDAGIIQLHRDPRESVPSGCSLYATYISMFRDRLDYEQIGRDYIDTWAHALAVGDAHREKIDSARIMDLQYRNLVSDPVGTVERIYDRFTLPFDDTFRAVMQKYLNKKMRKQHHYSLDQFSISSDTIEKHFQWYIDKYNIQSNYSAVSRNVYII